MPKRGYTFWDEEIEYDEFYGGKGAKRAGSRKSLIEFMSKPVDTSDKNGDVVCQDGVCKRRKTGDALDLRMDQIENVAAPIIDDDLEAARLVAIEKAAGGGDPLDLRLDQMDQVAAPAVDEDLERARLKAVADNVPVQEPRRSARQVPKTNLSQSELNDWIYVMSTKLNLTYVAPEHKFEPFDHSVEDLNLQINAFLRNHPSKYKILRLFEDQQEEWNAYRQ